MNYRGKLDTYVSNLPLDKRKKEVYSMTIHVRIET